MGNCGSVNGGSVLGMNRIGLFFAYHRRVAWGAAILLSLLVGALVALTDVSIREDQRLSLLQTEARRTSLEIMSSTLNGNLMGSITLLGLIDRDIKQEVSDGLMSVDAHVSATLSALGNSFGAEGVFLVGSDGIVKTSWDRINKPSTGLNVRFRPYYTKAMQGQASVYAAVSMARGDRALYFSAPVFAERARATSGNGAVVARTSLEQVDALLKGKFDQSLLLSPQGVVFAASTTEWVGMLEGKATPERMKAIRELKQFGARFDTVDPKPLPLSTAAGIQVLHGRRYVVGSAPVEWNDPSGNWQLLLLEDLARSVPLGRSLWAAAITSLAGILLGWMWIHLLRGRRVQEEASAQLKAYAKQQESSARFRSRLGEISMRLQHCESLEDLARVFLAEARDLLGVVQGAVYALAIDDPNCLRLAGASACAQPPAALLRLGEGLLGQCAVEQRGQLIATPPDGFWTLRSGLGSAQPAALLLAPLVLHSKLIGVVELAVLQVPQDSANGQFEEIVALLSNSMEILRRKRHTIDPLDASKG